MAAARTCFAKEGFKSTSVDDIAAEAGVSVGLLYRVFGSKVAIVEAIILEQVEHQIAKAYDIIASSPKTGIDRASVLTGFEDESLDFHSLALTFEMAAEACRDHALREFMQHRRASLFAKLMARLREDGMATKTAEAMFAELELIGAVASGAILQSLTNSEMSVMESIQTAFKTLERGKRKR